MDLKNNLSFTSQCSREWQREFAQEGYKIGSQLMIRKTPKFIVQSGPGFVAQNYMEEFVPLVVDQQKHVDVEFGSIEMTLSLDDWNRRIGNPTAIQLANEVDTAGLATYWQVANAMVSPETEEDKWYTYLKAAAFLDDEACPMDGQRFAVLDQWEEKAVVNANKGLFQSSTQIKNQYEEGTMGMSAGLKWSMDQNVAVHLTGPRGGAPAVNAGGQTGSSLVTNLWTAAAALRLRKGDVFVIAGVYAINPKNRLSTGRLRRFTGDRQRLQRCERQCHHPDQPPDPDCSGSAPDRDRGARRRGAAHVSRGRVNVIQTEHRGSSKRLYHRHCALSHADTGDGGAGVRSGSRRVHSDMERQRHHDG